ncbi:MAG: hypothetical protein R3F60_09715 [bacterium]
MTTWRELWPGEDGKIVYRLFEGSTLKAALVPVDSSSLSGLSAQTDYWLGAHPSTWASSFTLDKITRAAPTSAAAAKQYTLGSITLSSWHSTALEEFVASIGNHTWSTGRAWKAEVPELRTTEDHFLYIVWNGSDFEWVVTSDETAAYIDLDSTTTLTFSELTNLSITGVKGSDV